ncbi:MAG: response regulator transcription factor [Saprospiraceae bacterium]|nr:response regulator transcription factor [Saprospiraceae bacterium]
MKILIIEDEDLAVRKLQKILQSIEPSMEIIGVTDSIQSSVEWLTNQSKPDLIFMDIELADGQSFEIFNLIEVSSPVIFVTSYDEFALRAFKVNSVDYLLKPIQKDELKAALDKYRKLQVTQSNGNLENLIRDLQTKLQTRDYRNRFLVKYLQKLISIEVSDIAYFYSEGRINFFKTFDNKRYLIDYLLEDLEDMLDPKSFFRISRSFIISIECVDKIEEYFGSRLILQLKPAFDKEAIVSREKVSEFKKWMGK